MIARIFAADARARRPILWLMLLPLALARPSSPALAQPETPPEPADPTQTDSDEDEAPLKPTTLGIRFTPQMAAAMSKKFTAEMKQQYGLDDQQTEEIRKIMQRQFLGFANNNAELGRDMIELMMSTMIEHNGRFPKEEAQTFAKMARRFTPRLKEFITSAGAEVGKKMDVRQRLQFTADVGKAAAGMMVFESRMKRWEEGKIGDFANPFFDPADEDPAKAEPEPVDPKEQTDHRQARKMVETWIPRMIDKDKQWDGYIEQAVKFYGFTETQVTSAKAILKDCKDRAAAIKTPQWQDAVKENRIIQQLCYRAGGDAVSGVWINSIEREYNRLVRPMDDLDDEFKRRIDELANSEQRAVAREKVRKLLSEKGVKQLPT